MAKYLTNIPDEIIEFMNGKFNVFIEPEVKVGECRHYKLRLDDTEITPYAEPSQKAIDLQHAHDIENVARMNYSKGAEDAWEFARRIICPSDCCEDSISAHTKEIFNKGGWETRGIFNDLSYQEARDKYDAWKKEKEEIHIGDEVQYSLAGYEYTFIVFGKENDTLYGIRSDCEDGLDDLDDIYDGWETCYKSDNTLRKTGRHFDEVSNLLERIRE